MVESYSKFALTESEKESFKGLNDEFIKYNKWISDDTCVADAIEIYIRNLYNKIGMLDYNFYAMSFNLPCNDSLSHVANEDDVKKYLVKRATLSAMLQSFESDLYDKGFVAEKPFVVFPENSSIPEKIPSSFSIYHGTPVDDVSLEELGKPDKNGMYHIREGFVFYSPYENRADKFRKRNNQDFKGGHVFKKNDLDSFKVARVPSINGHFAFMYRDEIEKLASQGYEFIAPIQLHNTSVQIVDMRNYVGYFSARDSAIENQMAYYHLSFPVAGQSFDDYIDSLGISKDNAKQIADKYFFEENKTWSTGDKSNKSYSKSYDEYFPSFEEACKDNENIIRNVYEKMLQFLPGSSSTDSVRDLYLDPSRISGAEKQQIPFDSFDEFKNNYIRTHDILFTNEDDYRAFLSHNDILKDTADNIICHHKSLKLNDLITAKNISLSDLRKSYKQLWLDKDLNKKSSKEKLNENEKI